MKVTATKESFILDVRNKQKNENIFEPRRNFRIVLQVGGENTSERSFYLLLFVEIVFYLYKLYFKGYNI